MPNWFKNIYSLDGGKMLLFLLFTFSTHTPTNTQQHPPITVLKVYDLKYLNYKQIHIPNLTCFFYTNTPEETDNTPNRNSANLTPSYGSVALSRDLFAKYKLNFGDVICIQQLERCFLIEDRMNPKVTKAVDIFVFTRDKKLLNKRFPCNGLVYKWLD